MKSLQQFLEAHNFLIKGHTTKQDSDNELKFPLLDKIDDETYKFKEYRYVKIGKGPFYIYDDKYHNCKHIASKGDICGMIGTWYDDFEDFSEKDIIADFKTIKEAVIYMLKENGLSDTDLKEIVQYEDDTIITNNKGTKGYYDSDIFAYDVLIGNTTDKNCIYEDISIIDAMLDSGYYELTNLPKK